MTQFFAAYDDVSIYAIGTTVDEAIATARTETQNPDAQFQTARISVSLAAFIETHGWDLSRRFALVGGSLVDTTRVDDDADFVVCESEDGWSLHAPDSTDEEIAGGEALPLASGASRPTREDYDLARAQLDSPARASTWALRRLALASGITPTELSRVLGRDDRTMRRWLAGEQDVPDTLAQQVERLRITGVDDTGVYLTYRR
jgi:hypothetical protein